jgi:hypothetical protein
MDRAVDNAMRDSVSSVFLWQGARAVHKCRPQGCPGSPCLPTGGQQRAEEGPRREAGMIYCSSAASARTGLDTGRPTGPLFGPKAGTRAVCRLPLAVTAGPPFAQPQESAPGHWLVMVVVAARPCKAAAVRVLAAGVGSREMEIRGGDWLASKLGITSSKHSSWEPLWTVAGSRPRPQEPIESPHSVGWFFLPLQVAQCHSRPTSGKFRHPRGD